MKEKAAHPPLIVRYNFKIAFFQEILTSVEERAEFEAALRCVEIFFHDKLSKEVMPIIVDA